MRLLNDEEKVACLNFITTIEKLKWCHWERYSSSSLCYGHFSDRGPFLSSDTQCHRLSFYLLISQFFYTVDDLPSIIFQWR